MTPYQVPVWLVAAVFAVGIITGVASVTIWLMHCGRI